MNSGNLQGNLNFPATKLPDRTLKIYPRNSNCVWVTMNDMQSSFSGQIYMIELWCVKPIKPSSDVQWIGKNGGMLSWLGTYRWKFLYKATKIEMRRGEIVEITTEQAIEIINQCEQKTDIMKQALEFLNKQPKK